MNKENKRNVCIFYTIILIFMSSSFFAMEEQKKPALLFSINHQYNGFLWKMIGANGRTFDISKLSDALLSFDTKGNILIDNKYIIFDNPDGKKPYNVSFLKAGANVVLSTPYKDKQLIIEVFEKICKPINQTRKTIKEEEVIQLTNKYIINLTKAKREKTVLKYFIDNKKIDQERSYFILELYQPN